ncbi:hypothetical protein BDN70DRAFT_877210 [Pholiota conissans]|uniref:Uncharacterized protein n=1 Tax=Pholiota conissans TaxID=109636 RepID=A0A9P6D2K9_9AGAR|nr:hypothetical protein BDN70DRAFT_877210 [Pholiota conissans]
MEFTYPSSADVKAANAPAAPEPDGKAFHISNDTLQLLLEFLHSKVERFENELCENAEAVIAKAELEIYCREEVIKMIRTIDEGSDLRQAVEAVREVWTMGDKALFTAQKAFSILKSKCPETVHDDIDRDFESLVALSDKAQADSLVKAYNRADAYDERFLNLENRFAASIERGNVLAEKLKAMQLEGAELLRQIYVVDSNLKQN